MTFYMIEIKIFYHLHRQNPHLGAMKRILNTLHSPSVYYFRRRKYNKKVYNYIRYYITEIKDFIMVLILMKPTQYEKNQSVFYNLMEVNVSNADHQWHVSADAAVALLKSAVPTAA